MPFGDGRVDGGAFGPGGLRRAGSVIAGADGAAVTMTVDGVETPIKAGTYTGEIVLSLGQSDLISITEVDGQLYVNVDELIAALDR